MWNSDSKKGVPGKVGHKRGVDTLSSIQQANLRCLDTAFKEHWNLGQNILLCWCFDSEGVKVLPAPHYYLGRFSASLNESEDIDRLEALNGRFVRELISGTRQLSTADFRGAASRLQLTPVSVALPAPLAQEQDVIGAVDTLVQRYSINYVKSRGVLLLDIVDFSLVSPFEQTSQLNSLSYSLNVAHSRLREQNIEINFSRTTTGDGYYVWPQHDSPRANLDLFECMVLLIVENAMAQRAALSDRSHGRVVPKIRAGFHIGSQFEFYQVEGLNPGLNSYIVGDVTIELARMLDLASAGQIFVGDFDTVIPTSNREGAYLIPSDSQRFVERAVKQMVNLQGETLSEQTITAMFCFLTGETGASGGKTVRRFRITDKHGLSRNVYNLRINLRVAGDDKPIILGQQDDALPKRHYRRKGDQVREKQLKRMTRVKTKSGAFISALDD